MRIFHTDDHRLRNAKTELSGGQLVPPFECPARVDIILAEAKARGFEDIITPANVGLDHVATVHDRAYLQFLASCWSDWQAAGFKGEAIANVFPSRRMTRNKVPTDIEGKLGYYCLANETAISFGTWEGALASASLALAGAEYLNAGNQAAFALCRPPGHHAAQDMFGGYCFLNNAALAAQRLRDQGAKRVAILDVDFHHGNGTQAIFDDRPDVLVVNLHGHPDEAFPHFLGDADERGTGDGMGFTLNFPMREGTTFDTWFAALNEAIRQIEGMRPDALVVSLGVDTFEHDPISFFKLTSPDFTTYGQRLGQMHLPTLFCMEGGYAVDQIGINTVNVLEGFLQA